MRVFHAAFVLHADMHALTWPCPRQVLTNGKTTPLNPPYALTIFSAAYTGQLSAWNWDSTYQGNNTLGGLLSQVRGRTHVLAWRMVLHHSKNGACSIGAWT